MIKLAIPTGSLGKPTLELFEDADLEINLLDSRSYQAEIEDPRISEVRLLRPQEIPIYIADGLFNLGITGRDWIRERKCDKKLVVLSELSYSKTTYNPVRIVVAVPEDSDISHPEEIPSGSKITTEYVQIAKSFFAHLGIPVEVIFSYGTTEAKVPEICDVAVELTEQGTTLKANSLKIIGTIMESSTVLVTNKESYKEMKSSIDEITTLLMGALEARDKVLIKLNVEKRNLKRVVDLIPAMKAPTISGLMTEKNKYYAVESVVEKKGINVLIPKLKKAGAEDIIELPITKIII